MGQWKGWRRYFKRLFPLKSTIHKVSSSNFRFKSEGHRNGLLSLYKDMESCGEYADIQIMWKMIESSPHYACNKKRINRSSYWVVCFRPT
ncbi:hypothetical protein RJT34_17642 [Clitoria ternatea]|uniref:Uncharacterized protein n=1 Tax=Clitoria ternatea TaxID=43366 RepID=A0AAN9JAM8_CLITE